MGAAFPTSVQNLNTRTHREEKRHLGEGCTPGSVVWTRRRRHASSEVECMTSEIGTRVVHHHMVRHWVVASDHGRSSCIVTWHRVRSMRWHDVET